MCAKMETNQQTGAMTNNNAEDDNIEAPCMREQQQKKKAFFLIRCIFTIICVNIVICAISGVAICGYKKYKRANRKAPVTGLSETADAQSFNENPRCDNLLKKHDASARPPLHKDEPKVYQA